VDCEEFSMGDIFAFVYIFCVFGVLEERQHTRLKYSFYYTIVYVENIGMLLAWWYFTRGNPLWLQYLACIWIIGGFFVGVLFMILYYYDFHDKNYKKDPKHHIQKWIPLSDLKLVGQF